MTFAELVAAGLILLAQTRPDLASSQVAIKPSITHGDFAGFFDLDHPDTVWINPDNVYNVQMMRGQLAHELTHFRDWQAGILTKQTCGDDYFAAEYRAFKAQIEWQDWAEPIWRNYIRAQPFYQRPCPTP